jgi:hypothetical protein
MVANTSNGRADATLSADVLMERIRRVVADQNRPVQTSAEQGEPAPQTAAQAQVDFNQRVVESLGAVADLLRQAQHQLTVLGTRLRQAEDASTEVRDALSSTARALEQRGREDAAQLEGLLWRELDALEGRLRSECGERLRRLENQAERQSARTDACEERLEALVAAVAALRELETRKKTRRRPAWLEKARGYLFGL